MTNPLLPRLFKPSPYQVKLGKWLFTSNNCSFTQSVADCSQLWKDGGIPEIAFAGRSNVGKSSLMNAVVNSRKLIQASNTPGKTQTLNFFAIEHTNHVFKEINEDVARRYHELAGINQKKLLYLVDMPGYGFAKVPPAVSYEWRKLILEYISTRKSLRRVCVLVDSRHGLQNSDLDFLNMIEEQRRIPSQVILTKSDKVGKQALQKMIDDTVQQISHLKVCLPYLLTTSSHSMDGVDELRAELALVTGLNKYAT